MSKPAQVFICTTEDICEWWGLTGQQSQHAYDLEHDLERELELDPFEEAEVEEVPTHVLELYGA